MQLTQEHDALRESAIKFCQTEINPFVDEWERAGIFPAHELFKKMAGMGFLGITKPEQYGGMELDYSYGAVFNEATAYINCGGVPLGIGVQTDMATPALARFGGKSLCEEFLTPSISGEYVACIGVSESGAGSDAASIRTTAVRDGDDYVINGSKMWITNGSQADWMCLMANTSDDDQHRNKSLICVPLKEGGKRYKGVSISRNIRKMGMRSSDTAEIMFDDVRVPRRYLIGEEGKGFLYQMMQFQEERMYAALSALVQCERTVDETVEYARQRKAFGKSILDNQSVYFRLAELSADIEAVKSLAWRAVGMHVAGEDCTTLASMAKLKATRLAREVNDSCLQFWGGMGFVDESLVSRRYRDGRLASIGGGADEIMLEIIAKRLGMVPRKNQSR
ncbi:MAG: acyl-CoA dehydrogenase family protein [Haliea sp.]